MANGEGVRGGAVGGRGRVRYVVWCVCVWEGGRWGEMAHGEGVHVRERWGVHLAGRPVGPATFISGVRERMRIPCLFACMPHWLPACLTA
jgi:hypothetical protein